MNHHRIDPNAMLNNGASERPSTSSILPASMLMPPSFMIIRRAFRHDIRERGKDSVVTRREAKCSDARAVCLPVTEPNHFPCQAIFITLSSFLE
mmetsp:Transcript_16927/g.48912  ORF Transcript_16927/g.48912 Transcript_16927/m.48912 type:complete len:94 (-) Transcript_16927:910-1191(-)